MWQAPIEFSLVKQPAVGCHLTQCMSLMRQIAEGVSSQFSRQMKNKINTLLNCQIHTEDGRNKASRAAKSIGERAVTEILIKHQDPHSISSHLWTAVRARGCQFLGPAMQEEVLKLVLLSLEEGTALARKTLVLYVVQKISPQFPLQASKTAIGHVIQILYRASCFKLTKRDGESSLMQLKEEFRSYDALRREHDAQIVSIALESKLKISAEQWSSLLYGDSEHKSHMQSILDRLQPPNSFHQSIEDFKSLLEKNGDPLKLASLEDYFYRLANIDTIDVNQTSSSENLEVYLKSTSVILDTLDRFLTINKAAKSPGSGTKRIASTNHQFNYNKQNLPHSPNVLLIQSRRQPLLHTHPNLHHHSHPPHTRYS